MASLRREHGNISRDWEISKKHVGLYSGGKLDLFSPGGRDVLACLYGEDISFVDVTSGQVITTLQGVDEENENISSSGDVELEREVITTFCLNKKKSELVTASRNMILRHWTIHLESSPCQIKCKRTLKGHVEPILSMDYDPSGVFIATGSADRTARVWDMRGGFATHNFRGHGGVVSLVKFHPDVRKLLLITACDDCATRIWSLHDKSCVATLGNNMSVVTCIAFSYDGHTMVTGSRDKVINFWELRRNTLMKTLPVYEEVEGLCLVHGNADDETTHSGGGGGGGGGMKRKYNNDDACGTLVVIGSKGVARSWKFEAKDQDELAQVSRHGGRDDLLRCSEYEKQNNYVATPSPYTSLIYMNKTLMKRSSSDDGDNEDDEEKEMIICATADHNICFLNPYHLKIRRRIIGYFDEVNTVKHIPTDNNKLAIATNSDQLKLLKLNDFSCDIMEGHQGTIISLDVSPNGQYVITGSKDRTARVWNIITNQCILICIGHTQSVSACAFSRKLKGYEMNETCFFFTASGDKTIKKWKLDQKKVFQHFNNELDILNQNQEEVDKSPIQAHAINNIRAHEKDINHICVAPNDAIVISSSQDKTAKVWSVSDMSHLGTLKGHKRGIMQSCFSPINKSVATASGDRTIKIWSLNDYTCLNTLQGHIGSVCQIQYLNSFGLQLVSTGNDGLLKIWTIKTNECISTIDAHEDKIWALSIAHDSNTLVTGGADSVVKMWKDVTQNKEEEKLLEAEGRVLKEQKLIHSMKDKNYTQAIEYAFELDHSYKLWNIFNELIENIQENNSNFSNSSNSNSNSSQEEENKNDEFSKLSCSILIQIIQSFDDDRILKCLEYVVEWNKNVNKSFIAQTILYYILNYISFIRLKKINGLLELINALLPYTERHFNRIDRLTQASFLIDYSCAVMSTLHGDDEQVVN